jgi:hypothetical protein
MLIGFLALIAALAVVFMAVCILADGTAIMPGQRWHIKGVGPVVITKVLGYGAEFSNPEGKGFDVEYRTTVSRVGYCKKGDIRNIGMLLPYDKIQAEIDMKDAEKQKEIDSLVLLMRKKKAELMQEWAPYKPPQSRRLYDDVTIMSDNESENSQKDETVVEAEIIYPKQFRKQ